MSGSGSKALGGRIVVGDCGGPVGRRWNDDDDADADGRFSIDIKLTVVSGRCVIATVDSSVDGFNFCFVLPEFVVVVVVLEACVGFFFVVVVMVADFVGCDGRDDVDDANEEGAANCVDDANDEGDANCVDDANCECGANDEGDANDPVVIDGTYADDDTDDAYAGDDGDDEANDEINVADDKLGSRLVDV